MHHRASPVKLLDSYLACPSAFPRLRQMCDSRASASNVLPLQLLEGSRSGLWTLGSMPLELSSGLIPGLQGRS